MINLDHFRFRPSAKFFKRVLDEENTSINISRNDIQAIFDRVSSKKEGNYRHIELKTTYFIGSEPIIYSLCVFVKKATPSFLIKEANKLDEIHAFLLIVEFSDFLVVNSSNAMFSVRHLRGFAIEVEHSILSRCLVKKNTAIEKLDTESMDGSDNAIRTRSVSSRNLRTSWAPTTSGRQLIDNMRINDAQRIYVVNPNASKLYETASPKVFRFFLDWSWQIIGNIRNFRKKSNYLDNFAEAISFSELHNGRHPTTVLIAGWKLTEIYEKDNAIKECKLIEEDESEIRLKISKIVEIFNDVFLLKKIDDNNFELVHPGSKQNEDENSRNPYLRLKYGIRLRKNSGGYSLFSKTLSRIKIEYDNGAIQSLGSFIKNNNAFQVTFNDPTVIYWSGKPFKDPGLAGRLEGFISVFKPIAQLSSILDEKAEGRLRSNAISFPTDCLFGFIESQKQLGEDADYLICDDLGDEWADYIAIKENKYVRFIHAKSKKESLSASAFQDVVGQAIKNLGNISNIPELSRKLTSWKSNWSGTNIKRLRKGGSLQDAVQAYKKTIARADSVKEVCLVVDFISKRSLELEMKAFIEKTSSEHQLSQLFWLITTFVSSCLDNPAKATIYCLK